MELDEDMILIWDDKKKKFGGHLQKKAGSKAKSKGGFRLGKNWTKRYYSIEREVKEDENFTLDYYTKQGEKRPKERIPLWGAEILYEPEDLEDAEYEHEFHLVLVDRENPYILACDTANQLHDWVETLHYVIELATRREERLKITGDDAFGGGGMMDGNMTPKSGSGAFDNGEDEEGREFARRMARTMGDDERFIFVLF